MRRVAVLALVFALAACQSQPVLLRHADGGEVTCGPYLITGFQATAGAMQEAQCIGDYQRQGFERVPN